MPIEYTPAQAQELKDSNAFYTRLIGGRKCWGIFRGKKRLTRVRKMKRAALVCYIIEQTMGDNPAIKFESYSEKTGFLAFSQEVEIEPMAEFVHLDIK